MNKQHGYLIDIYSHLICIMILKTFFRSKYGILDRIQEDENEYSVKR
jgi:hypothetical protein